MVLVDTNVLVDVWQNDLEWSAWSVAQLRAQAQVHELAINPIIYAELSLSFKSIETLDARVRDLGLLLLELSRAALFLAGQAFQKSTGERAVERPAFSRTSSSARMRPCSTARF